MNGDLRRPFALSPSKGDGLAGGLKIQANSAVCFCEGSSPISSGSAT